MFLKASYWIRETQVKICTDDIIFVKQDNLNLLSAWRFRYNHYTGYFLHCVYTNHMILSWDCQFTLYSSIEWSRPFVPSAPMTLVHTSVPTVDQSQTRTMTATPSSLDAGLTSQLDQWDLNHCSTCSHPQSCRVCRNLPESVQELNFSLFSLPRSRPPTAPNPSPVHNKPASARPGSRTRAQQQRLNSSTARYKQLKNIYGTCVISVLGSDQQQKMGFPESILMSGQRSPIMKR